MNIKRGDIYFIRPQATTGSEQRAGRPAVVVSNDMNNRCSTAVEVVYLTTQPKKDLPTHVTIRSAPQKSVALCEQIDTVATERIGTYAGHVSDTELMNLEIGMMISLGIDRATADIPEDLPHEMPDPVYPPREEELQAELAVMTAKYDTLRGLYDGLLAAVLTQRKQ